MRVLVASSLHPADDPRIFHKEALSLAKRYDVDLIAVGERLCIRDGVRIHPLKRKQGKVLGTLGAWIAILREVKYLRPGVFHFHDPDLLPIALALQLKNVCSVVYDVHEDVGKAVMDKTWLPRWLRRPLAFCFDRFEKLAASRFDGVVAATEGIARAFKIPEPVVVRNFTPLVPDRPRKPFTRRRPLRLIYVGSITEVRGILQIISALDFLKVKAQLVLLGRVHSAAFLRKVHEAMAGRNVLYLGVEPFERVFDRLCEADVGLCCFLPAPNHLESLPNKLFEYMAARLPIVASNFPLWQRIVEGGGCGVVVNPEDPGEIARAIDGLAANPRLMLKMGQAGRALFEKEYNWSLEEQELFNLYSRLEARVLKRSPFARYSKDESD